MTTTTDLDAALDDALDHIDDDTDRPVTDRPAPFVTALPADALFADPTYQRSLDDLRVQNMVDDFDPTLLGVIEVSERADGRYAILDGQHRWAAALEAHPARTTRTGVHLVCQVHRGLSLEDEARTFYEIDVRRKVLSGWDRWKARRGAGDPVVLGVEQIVSDAGLTVDPASRDGNVGATKALETIYSGGSGALLHNTLFVVTQAYGAVRDAMDGQLLQGVAIVLEAYDRDELDVDRLIAQLQTIPPRQIKARAQVLREAHRAELPRLCAAVMVDRYNAGKGPKLEDLLSRAPANTKLLNKTGARSRQLAAIRRWANRNGVPCAEKARIAQRVIDAYTAAHPGFRLSVS